jgi:cytochrome c oxidase subunit IV
MPENSLDGHEHQHIMSYSNLAAVLACLLVLTSVTVSVSYFNMGHLNVPIALTIAATKASLVLWYFMHLKYEGPVIRLSFVCTIVFLVIMISFIFWDVAYR